MPGTREHARDAPPDDDAARRHLGGERRLRIRETPPIPTRQSRRRGASRDDAGACVNADSSYPRSTRRSDRLRGRHVLGPGGVARRQGHARPGHDVNTDPRGGICQDTDTNAPDYCYNGFGVLVQLTDTFRAVHPGFFAVHPASGLGLSPAGRHRLEPRLHDGLRDGPAGLLGIDGDDVRGRRPRRCRSTSGSTTSTS